jgi:serine/threonine protein kinase
VHGDLRGANILVSDAENACLTDFGLTVLSDASTSESRPSAGCARWMAPELLNPLNWGVQNRPRTPASDIYAFACVCLEVRVPYSLISDVLTIPLHLTAVHGTSTIPRRIFTGFCCIFSCCAGWQTEPPRRGCDSRPCLEHHAEVLGPQLCRPSDDWSDSR